MSETNTMRKDFELLAGPSGQQFEKTKKWIALLAWIMALWAFAFLFAPWLQKQSTSIQTLATYIDRSGIDAGAIYYTDVEEVGEGDLMIRDTFRFYLPQQETK